MSELKRLMPILARNEGVWDGWYRYYDAEGNKIDEHRSRLVCRFFSAGPYPYHQTNHYTWSDGRTEVRDFPATYREKRAYVRQVIDRYEEIEALDLTAVG